MPVVVPTQFVFDAELITIMYSRLQALQTVAGAAAPESTVTVVRTQIQHLEQIRAAIDQQIVECRKVVKVKKDAKSDQPTDGWRPIDTAPQDGDMLLCGMIGARSDVVCIGQWDPKAQRMFVGRSGQYEFVGRWIITNPTPTFRLPEFVTPTHWQPIPRPPAR